MFGNETTDIAVDFTGNIEDRGGGMRCIVLYRWGRAEVAVSATRGKGRINTTARRGVSRPPRPAHAYRVIIPPSSDASKTLRFNFSSLRDVERNGCVRALTKLNIR